jgi:hypothetical protein
MGWLLLFLVGVAWYLGGLRTHGRIITYRLLRELPINPGTLAACLLLWPVLEWEMYRSKRWPHRGPAPVAWPALRVIQGSKR